MHGFRCLEFLKASARALESVELNFAPTLNAARFSSHFFSGFVSDLIAPSSSTTKGFAGAVFFIAIEKVRTVGGAE